MTEAELNRRINVVLAKFDDVNTFYIEKGAKQIALIGELTASSINIIAVLAAMNKNIAEINAKLARAAQLTRPALNRLYNDALNDVYHDQRFERAMQETPLPDSSKRALERYAQSISRQTSDTMENLSQTTAVSHTYRQTVDRAILSVSSGLGDYHSMIRSGIRELGYNGLQVEYESGYRRRLDTALRQNIVDGTKQIQQRASDMIGEELGFDAKEISVHANSAPDHEPVQGHVFLNDQFKLLQTNQSARDVDGRFFPAMERPIGQWNCMHFAFSFSTKHSKRKYTNEQLLKFSEDNAKGCKIDGKHYSLYEARQYMRRIETEIRRQKDVGVAAQAAGDDELRQEAQRKINGMSKKYSEIAKLSGLSERRDRMTVEGFRAVKIKDAV